MDIDMNMVEYNQVCDMTYLEYCDYLQNKYGIGKCNYMSKNYNKNPKVTRTKEGLIAHHKMEDRAIMLSHKDFAMKCPIEWQYKENIVYCDYLEHLLLHTLICKYPSPEKLENNIVGEGGVVFISSELNDVYSGFKTNQEWRKTCYDKIINDKDVYLKICRFFMEVYTNDYKEKYENRLLNGELRRFEIDILFKSSIFNELYCLWDSKYNVKIYKEIYYAIQDLFTNEGKNALMGLISKIESK